MFIENLEGNGSTNAEIVLIDLLNERRDVPVGAMIIYLLLYNGDFSVRSTQVGGREMAFSESKESFTKTFSLLEKFISAGSFGPWNENYVIVGTVENETVTFKGKLDSNVVSVSFPTDLHVSIMKILLRIEEESYKYNLLDKRIVDYLCKMEQMTTRQAVVALGALRKYSDLLEEYARGIREDGFVFVEDTPITVQGMTASELFEKYRFSHIGVYNYLSYLRESPEEAKKDLDQNVPRKHNIA